MVEGTPLLRVQAGNRLEGSNPFHSATCPRESVLPIRMWPDFSVVSEGYLSCARSLSARHSPSEASKPSRRRASRLHAASRRGLHRWGSLDQLTITAGPVPDAFAGAVAAFVCQVTRLTSVEGRSSGPRHAPVTALLPPHAAFTFA